MTDTEAPSTYDLKSATLNLAAFLLKSNQLDTLQDDLSQQHAANPGFFNDDPVVIDLSAVAEQDLALDIDRLLGILRGCALNPVAFKGGSPAQSQAAKAAGLFESEDSVFHAPRVETVVHEVIREVVQAAPAPCAAVTLIVDRPLRSGQQVYAKGGDLVVTAAVNQGAELIADGSIHVYAPLRGKAIAGAKGDQTARIFAMQMSPELISIAGIYRTGDTPLPEDVSGQAAQIKLHDERLVFEALQR